jgi:hypothetical protein
MYNGLSELINMERELEERRAAATQSDPVEGEPLPDHEPVPDQDPEPVPDHEPEPVPEPDHDQAQDEHHGE